MDFLATAPSEVCAADKPTCTDLFPKYESFLSMQCFDTGDALSIIIAIICAIFLGLCIVMIRYSYKAEVEILETDDFAVESSEQTYCIFSSRIIKLTRLVLLILVPQLFISLVFVGSLDKFATMFNSEAFFDCEV
jgi:hypothetical protein